MIKGGYILQPRSIDESEASKMPPVTRELWFYLLRKVNYSDGPKFKRGQNFFNLSDIQNDLCWYAGYRKMMYSKPQLTKSLRRLNEGNMVETTKATRGIIVTICNYDLYQDPKNYEGNDGGSTKEPRKKREGHTKNKKVKEEEKEEYSFEDFYQSYPRKTQRAIAEKSWNKLTLLEQEEAIKHLPTHISSEQWQDKKFIPHPATWLNQKRWQDEIEESETKAESKPMMSDEAYAKARELASGGKRNV